MAQTIEKLAPKRKHRKDEKLPLGKENFMIIGLGVAVIVAGYLALAKGPIEGFLPLILAPVMVVLGYCVIIPLGILYRKSYLKSDQANPPQTAA